MTPDEFRAAFGVALYANTTDPAPGNPVVSIRRQTRDGAYDGRGCWIWCPGCDEAHRPMIAGEAGDRPVGPCWEWNGRDDHHFGIEPSLLVQGGNAAGPTVCHSFLRDGQWEFLTDSTHALAGRTIPMVPLPDWLVR